MESTSQMTTLSDKIIRNSHIPVKDVRNAIKKLKEELGNGCADVDNLIDQIFGEKLI